MSHTITKRNLPKFEEKQKKPKTMKQIARFVTKKTGAAQKQIGIARERNISTK